MSIVPKGPAAPNGAESPSEPLTRWLYSQHQVAALKLTAVQGPTREVGLLRALLPVLERRLRWGLKHLIWVRGQLLMEDTFLSKYVRSGGIQRQGGWGDTPGSSYPGKERRVQLIGEVHHVFFQEAGRSEASALCPS